MYLCGIEKVRLWIVSLGMVWSIHSIESQGEEEIDNFEHDIDSALGEPEFAGGYREQCISFLLTIQGENAIPCRYTDGDLIKYHSTVCHNVIK